MPVLLQLKVHYEIVDGNVYEWYTFWYTKINNRLIVSI